MPDGRIVGPVFGYELTAVARRGGPFRQRLSLVAVLLAVLLVTYAGQFGWDAVTGTPPTVDPRTGRFAERFALTVLAVQLLAVLVLTPAVVGGAITDERDRGTLDLLRTTALTDREIVLGKLLARLAAVGAVVAAGLPVLALAFLFGGIDPDRVLAAYAVTAGAGFGVGACSAYLATVRDNLRGVVLTAYAVLLVATAVGSACWLVPGMAGLSPVSALFASQFPPDPVRMPAAAAKWHGWNWPIAYAIVYGGGGLTCIRLAIANVRTTGVKRLDDVDPGRPTQRRFFARPLDDDADPLAWQEREFGGRRLGGGWLSVGGSFVLFAFGAVLFVGLATVAERGGSIGVALDRAARPLVAFAAVVTPLLVGTRLADAIGREKDRQTLDALLLLPGERRQILRSKLKAALGWAWLMVLLPPAAAGLAILTGGVGLGAGLLALCHAAAATALAVGAAAWLGVRAPTAYRGTVLFLAGGLAAVAGPLVAAPVLDWFALGDLLRGVSPPVGAWQRRAILPVVIHPLIGWGLWRAAGRSLGRIP
jgi:ABC-type transport system involved in multi-copper enzyme maturation permease subunit